MQVWMRQIVEHKEKLIDDTVFYMVGLKSDLKDPTRNFSVEAEVRYKTLFMTTYW